MKNNTALNVLVYIILSFFYKESCRCIKIDREVHDKIDSLNGTNCDGISHSIFEAGRCRCSITSESSITTSYTGGIACVSNTYLEKGCRVSEVTNATVATIYAKTFLNCSTGIISKTQYWNMRFGNTSFGNWSLRGYWYNESNVKNLLGYWHNESNIKNYLTLQNDGSLFLDNRLALFDGLMLRIEINCGVANDDCRLVKIFGSRDYPIYRFITNATKARTIATATTVGTTSTTTSKNLEGNEATAKTDCSYVHSKLNSSNDNKNVVVISVTVSVATLINIIVWIFLWRSWKRKYGKEDVGTSPAQLTDQSYPMKDERTQRNLEYNHTYENFNKMGNSPTDKTYSIKDERVQENLQQRHSYENFTIKGDSTAQSKIHNESDAKPPPESEEQKQKYMELAIHYQHNETVYATLSQ